jgi:hypothetical protein
MSVKNRAYFIYETSIFGISIIAFTMYVILCSPLTLCAQPLNTDTINKHHLGLQLTPILNPIAPALQFQYIYRPKKPTAFKLEAGYLYDPIFKQTESRNGIRLEFSYISIKENYRIWGVTAGGRYALHRGNAVPLERFSNTTVNVVERDGIRMRSRLGGIWYMMGGQFLYDSHWYSQIEFMLGLIVYDRVGLNVPPGETLFRGDSFFDFLQPNAFRARVLPSIRIYYSWGRKNRKSIIRK